MRATLFGLIGSLIPCMSQAQAAPEMLERALSSVVTVAIYKADYSKQVLGIRGNEDLAYARFLDLANAVSTGSGFAITMDGKTYVATNAHVIENATDEDSAIYVYSIDQTRYRMRVRGGDSFYDFALLEFLDPIGPEITTLIFTQEVPHIGERVFAIGNPLGEYPYSVSDGIISAKNRMRGGLTGKFGFLQSTATVIWGNSGGPLINERGEVVGMNSQIAFAERGDMAIWQPQINFALEAAICRRLSNDILTNDGRIRRCYLGVEITQSSRAMFDPNTYSSTYELVDPRPVLNAVLEDSPAREILSASIGNAIMEVNGEQVRNLEEVYGELEKVAPGSTVDLTFLDNDRMKTIKVPTTSLAAPQLEGLARGFVTGDGSVRLSSEGQQVLLNIKDGSPAIKRRNAETVLERQLDVIGIGTADESGADIWRVNAIADMGAALRLHGPTGFCDLVCNELGIEEPATPQTVRVFFSGSEEVLRATLWY